MAMSYPSLGQQKVYNASWTRGGVTVFISSWGCAVLNAWRRGCRGRKERGVALKVAPGRARTCNCAIRSQTEYSHRGEAQRKGHHIGLCVPSWALHRHDQDCYRVLTAVAAGELNEAPPKKVNRSIDHSTSRQASGGRTARKSRHFRCHAKLQWPFRDLTLWPLEKVDHFPSPSYESRSTALANKPRPPEPCYELP